MILAVRSSVFEVGNPLGLLPTVIIFIAGYYLCRPVAEHVALPWWAGVPVIAGHFIIYELLFVACLLTGGAVRAVNQLSGLRPDICFTVLSLVFLACACAMASLGGSQPLRDLGEAMRMCLMAMMMLAACSWSARNPVQTLRIFITGSLAGSLVNLFFSFLYPVHVFGILPTLLGQNGPGPSMALAVVLVAALRLTSSSRGDVVLGWATFAICGFGSLISYSKIALLILLCGIVANLACTSWKRRSARISAAVATVFVGAAILSGAMNDNSIASSTGSILSHKLQSLETESGADSSLQQRLSYFSGTAEISMTHPFGVGFSGFKRAMMETETYLFVPTVDESSIDETDSNPHANFLYFLSAGGVPGGLLCLAAFAGSLLIMQRGLKPFRASGLILFGALAVSYFTLFLTVPYYSSVILAIPVGALAHLGARHMPTFHHPSGP